MAWVSLGAGLFALLLTVGGFLFALVPYVGSAFAFSAPVIAIAGIITGGVAMSDAKRRGDPSSAPFAGLVVSILATVPAILVAVSCGLCNACETVGGMKIGPQQRPGPIFEPPSPPSTPPTGEDAAPAPPGAPPPAFPPPPMTESSSDDVPRAGK